MSHDWLAEVVEAPSLDTLNQAQAEWSRVIWGSRGHYRPGDQLAELAAVTSIARGRFLELADNLVWTSKALIERWGDA
jgi:hypothetical protein